METHLQTLARAQAELGMEVCVVCVNHRNESGKDVTWNVLAWTRTQEERDGPINLTRLGRRASVARLDLCPGLLPWLAKARAAAFDLMHLHAPNPTMLLALAALPMRVPLVITHHSDVVRQKTLSLMQRPFEHVVYRRAVCVLVDSPSYQEGSLLLQRYAEKVHTLPLGIELEPYLDPSPTALEHAATFRQKWGHPLWLSVGRIVYYKGLHNAIRALPHVPGQLMVVGEGPLKPELQALAKAMGVADRIHWMGRLNAEELIGAYHAATALWFPSNARSEGFGLVQVEAMASGCPVINSAIPASGVAWVSLHEQTGLTIPVDDPDALATAANRLAASPDLRDRLGQQARARARSEFDDGLMAQRSLEHYRNVLSPKNHPVAPAAVLGQ